MVADEREPAPAELLPLLDGTVLQGERLVLAYRAARDGWTASAFHAAVDSRGPLLLVGRTTQGQRFGAYVSVGFASREDYRDTNSAFLLRWSDGDDAAPEVLPRTGPPAVFDFAAQGPCFGADALRIPLGLAPAQGSSYAAVTGSGGGGVLGPSHAAGSRAARSRLGSHYAVRRDGGRTLFADGEGMDATLVELEGFVSPGREGAM